jgi:hypothetical protein
MLNLFTSFFAVSCPAKRNIFIAITAFITAFNTSYAQDTIKETEPNNTIATANYLAQDTVMEGAICPAGLNADVDYFKIKPNSDGILKIKASITQDTVTGRIVPLDFGFFDDSSRYIEGFSMASDSPGSYASDSLVFYCVSADTFYIRVYDEAFTNDCHNYFFSYSIVPPVFNNTVDTVKAGLFFGLGNNIYGDIGYYDTSTYHEYRVLKIDTDPMELYIRASTQSGDTTTRLNIFYADSSGSVIGNFPAMVGVNNQVYFDSLTIPAAPVITDTTVIDSFGSIYDDTLALDISFTSGVCGSYELYYTSPSTGINMLHALHGNIILFPNPSSGMVRLIINSPQKGTFSCDVFNVMGEDVYKTPLLVTEDNTIMYSTDLNLSYLPKGIYFVRISNGQNATTRLLAIE